MRWSDEAIVLSARRHGESALLVHLLTRDAWPPRRAGARRAAAARRARLPDRQPAAVVMVGAARRTSRDRSRASSRMAYAARADRRAGAAWRCLAAAAALADAALPEREPHPRAYSLGLVALCDALEADRGWCRPMPSGRLALLAELGFGLDLARCAVTGTAHEPAYVSPRSGPRGVGRRRRALSRAAAAPAGLSARRRQRRADAGRHARRRCASPASSSSAASSPRMAASCRPRGPVSLTDAAVRYYI